MSIMCSPTKESHKAMAEKTEEVKQLFHSFKDSSKTNVTKFVCVGKARR